MYINIINTTTDSNKTATMIGEYLVNNKLSPCVQIVPQTESLFKWNGNVENKKEFLLIIKTIPQHVKECKKNILKLHNYNVPEIIVTKGEILLDTYKIWFTNNCK